MTDFTVLPLKFAPLWKAPSLNINIVKEQKALKDSAKQKYMLTNMYLVSNVLLNSNKMLFLVW